MNIFPKISPYSYPFEDQTNTKKGKEERQKISHNNNYSNDNNKQVTRALMSNNHGVRITKRISCDHIRDKYLLVFYSLPLLNEEYHNRQGVIIIDKHF